MSVKKPQTQTISLSQDKPPTPTEPKAKKQQGNLLFIGLGLTAVSLVSAAAGAMLAVSLSTTPLRQSSLSPEEEKVFSKDEAIAYKNLHLPELSRPVNILVLGTKVLTSDLEEKPQEDLGYHALVNSFKGLSDTMVLLRFDPNGKKLKVLSIPRDTQADLGETYGIRKINEANYHGGPALAAEAVSNLLEGVSIDRYVRVNVQGVEKVIDALGGVKVYVPKDMKYSDDSQHLYIDLKKGEQHLDGEKAVAFLRFRYDRYGDIGRVQRQQVLMRAVVEQALKPQTILKMPEIMSVIGAYIDTNLTVEELVALAGFAAQTERSNVQMLMVPGGFSGDGKTEISYWLPNPDQIRQMVAEYFNHGEVETLEETDTTNLRIAIQDSTEDPEAVQQMVRYLQEAGYRRVFVSDNWEEPLATTRILAQQGDDVGASMLRASLGVGEVLVESTGTLASDITIVLGKDWREHYVNLSVPQQDNLVKTQYNN
ncbi:cell envelope-related transcriptional attenuator [Rippkaea orientalis PCC 8801]|uniref:Cell envelope-related transcriptional attenuator n=1 Tax=Rippkaea orientalis (strain PCC 8801 / RF-1) TaxID=41431 RepID=B7K246_RIPO1|nr:LCP family protein [Rippkaea orientalis]ACK65182.1 cell envelope-related transcriptional attenuator [Rippkaea orientalis PCC 8801]